MVPLPVLASMLPVEATVMVLAPSMSTELPLLPPQEMGSLMAIAPVPLVVLMVSDAVPVLIPPLVIVALEVKDVPVAEKAPPPVLTVAPIDNAPVLTTVI